MSASKATDGERSSFLRSLMTKAPSAAVGALAAIVTVLVVDHWRARAPDPAAPDRAVARISPASSSGERVFHRLVVDQKAFDRITELERQVREMREARAADAGAPVAQEELLDPVEARRRVDEMYAELDRAHERDSSDPGWAPGATARFGTGLRALGEKIGFKVAAADCKMTSCRATVTWSNYATARATGPQLVERFFGGLNCGQKIRLGEPADPNVPYTTQVYLDCTDLRSGAVDEIAQAASD